MPIKFKSLKSRTESVHFLSADSSVVHFTGDGPINENKQKVVNFAIRKREKNLTFPAMKLITPELRIQSVVGG